MAQPTYIARKGEDADFAALTVDSLVVNTVSVTAGAITLADAELITLGTGSDVTVQWDATNLLVAAAADDEVIEIGDSAATQKSFDLKWYGNGANGADYLYFDASANLVYTTGVDLQFKDNDMLVFGTGAGGTGDAQMRWDATDLDLLPTADDSVFAIGNGTLSFDVKIFQGAAGNYWLFDASDNALELVGDSRLDLSGATVAAGNTDGGVIKGGTSVAPITEDTASMKFISYYFDDGATSGTAVGEYVKLSVTGAGGSGVAMRPYAIVDTAAGATIHTVQATLGFAGGGTLSGAGNAIYANVMLPTEAVTGTLAAMTAEVYSENAASDPAGSVLSIFRVSNAGETDGKADVDDDCYLFNFDGWGVGDANMIAVKAAAACPNVTHSVRVRLPNGNPAYIYLGETALTA
jgi:hypothetical protein